jgi:hypothetical protein
MEFKNLSQFQSFLKKIEGDQSWEVVATKKFVTTYHENHPAFQKYENGVYVREEITAPSFISKAQTYSFARKVKADTGNEINVWMQFEKASKWKFEGNTAIYSEQYVREGDHVSEVSLTFEFTKI